MMDLVAYTPRRPKSGETLRGDSFSIALGGKGFNQADIISLHVPLTTETNQMVNESFLNSFKKEITLINTARGKVVNTQALVDGMKSGKVKYAALDVLEYESVSFENLDASKLPEAFQYLIKSDRVLLSPHIAGFIITDFKINKFLYYFVFLLLCHNFVRISGPFSVIAIVFSQ